jgi:GNAT superfamily N-acetyltransferase
MIALAPLFTAGSHRAVEMTERDVGRLQEFLEANPEYYAAVNGAPPARNEAREEFDSQLPAGWRYDKRWLLEIAQRDGTMTGMASLVSNMLAEGVWHIGLFIVATRLHGGGAAREIYAALEAWMRAGGARWLRLGVVQGNGRAERFWEKSGYIEVRKRLGVPMGERVNDLRVMVKPLAGGTIAEYLVRVARARPDAP